MFLWYEALTCFCVTRNLRSSSGSSGGESGKYRMSPDSSPRYSRALASVSNRSLPSVIRAMPDRSLIVAAEKTNPFGLIEIGSESYRDCGTWKEETRIDSVRHMDDIAAGEIRSCTPRFRPARWIAWNFTLTSFARRNSR